MPKYTVRDSAGVRVVENWESRLDDAEGWRLGAQPLLRIGGPRAEGLAALYRVSDAMRLSDGTLVVVNAGTYELRFFDDEANPITSVGRYGGGPGEFEDLYHIVRLPGDSALAFDGLLARATKFTLGGDLASVETLEAPGAGYLFFRGRLEDGRLLVYRGWTSASDTFPLRTARYPTRRALVLIGDRAPDTVGVFPGSEHFVLVRGDRRTYTSAPFPHSSYELAAGSRIFLARNNEYELRRITTTGEAVEVIRRTVTRVPVGPEHIEAFRSARLDADDSPQNRRTVEAIIDGAGLPEYLPVLSGMLADAEGNLWVRAYEEPYDTASSWSVFSRDGEWITEVTVPADGRVFDIGADYLLGVWRDELDVEQLRLYALLKPDRGPNDGIE